MVSLLFVRDEKAGSRQASIRPDKYSTRASRPLLKMSIKPAMFGLLVKLRINAYSCQKN